MREPSYRIGFLAEGQDGFAQHDALLLNDQAAAVSHLLAGVCKLEDGELAALWVLQVHKPAHVLDLQNRCDRLCS